MEEQRRLPKDKKRDWSKYNLAKTKEKMLFYDLLFELAELIIEPVHNNGRPPIPIKDLFFSAGLKLYSNYSGRKISSDLKQAEYMGYISKAPHFNTMHDFLNCPITYDLLKRLLTISAMPLKQLEDAFSMDSSGFGAYQQESWKKVRYSDRYNDVRNWRTFLKGHICIGTRTNVIATCEVTSAFVGDPTVAPKLLEGLNGNFNVQEVSADKAYSSMRIHQLIKALDAMPYIPFKDNANPHPKSPEIWRRMYDYFKNNRELFLEKYHKRSNVETTFAMVKMRLGEFLKCKTFISQRNELMMKFICHNICCLISEIFLNNIKIDFKKCEAAFVHKPIEGFENLNGKKPKRKYDKGGFWSSLRSE